MKNQSTLKKCNRLKTFTFPRQKDYPLKRSSLSLLFSSYYLAQINVNNL
jgi:hypothetical protein